MMHGRMNTGVATCLMIGGFGVAGCNVTGLSGPSAGPNGPMTAFPEELADSGYSAADAHEVDLVEAVVAHRGQYQRTLRQLHDYYRAKGYAAKAEWASYELDGLSQVKKFLYVLDAEVPSTSLRPEEEIAEADSLYNKGLDLMRRGGHGIPGVYREDRMVEAAQVFRGLIERYPTSDKIDDAAFYLGEIHNLYLKGQKQLAAQWYERAFAWNPDTPHPARFQAAVVFDHDLQDRDRALELYHDVLNRGTAANRSVRHSSRRVYELTQGAATPSARSPG